MGFSPRVSARSSTPFQKLLDSASQRKQRRRGSMPRLRFWADGNGLAPVTFDQDPTAAAMDPVMPDPVSARVRRAIPATGNPYIAAAVPALITSNPHITALWRWRTALNDWGRWANANHDLRKRSGRRQTKGKEQCHCGFLHGYCVLQVFDCRNRSIVPALVVINARSME